MSQSNLCRLCVHHLSRDSKSLYDENGFGNELYEITFKYFHPLIVNMDKWKDLTDICVKCWRYIWDFHNFQNSVLMAQVQLNEKDKLTVKTEKEYDFSQEFQRPLNDIRSLKVEGDFISLPEMEALEAGGDTPLNTAEIRTGAIRIFDKPPRPNFKSPAITTSRSVVKVRPDFISLPEFELVDVHSDQGGSSEDDDLPSTSSAGGVKKGNDNSLLVMLGDDALKDEEADVTMLSYQFGSDYDDDDDDGDNDNDSQRISRKKKSKSFEDETYSDWNDSSDDGNGIRTNTTRAERNEELDELMAKWMPNLKCALCSRSCSSWPALQGHYRQRHPNDDCYITCCGRKLREHWTIKEHLRFHDDPTIFKCKLCDKCHSTKCSLKRHIDVHHPEIQPIKCICKLCGKGFTTKSGLNYHSTTVHDSSHQPERLVLADGRILYRCKDCGKKFTSPTTARQHVWYNHRYKPKYPCTLCPKSFRQPRQLREHTAAHTGKHLYACAYCTTTFTYFNSLQGHRKAKHPTQSDENFYTMLDDR